MMGTTKLYQQDVYLKEWDAEITAITDKGVYLDKTAFFPEGGGQSCDRGIMTVSGDRGLSVEVLDVQEDGEDIVHAVSSPGELAVGGRVHCSLDWDRRFDNMQRHCGEHILSGIFYRECGGVNRGFHMGEDYMTIDISFEEQPSDLDMPVPEELDWELAKRCELLANRVIWSDVPVTVFRFDEREEAQKLPLRKALAVDEDISIVCVGSPENAADCVACCGTHPSTAGQVGLIKLYKVEKYKGMFRVYCEAGARALADYGMKHDLLTELSNERSCSIEDFPAKVRGTESRLAEVKAQLAGLKKTILSGECRKLNAVLRPESESAGKPLILHTLNDMSIDDAFNMAKEYMGNPICGGRLIMLYAPDSKSYILVSDGTPACGPLVKEYAGFYNGKGGGNDVSARAMFTTEEDASLFADLLSKHLK